MVKEGIIQQWILNSLGIDVKMKKLSRNSRDGTLITQLLYYFKIISEQDLKSIRKTQSSIVAYENYIQIAKWLKNIQIILSKRDMREIIEEKHEAVINLYYKLFIKIEEMNQYEKVKKMVPRNDEKAPNTPLKQELLLLQSTAELGKQVESGGHQMNQFYERLMSFSKKIVDVKTKYKEFVREKNLKTNIIQILTDFPDARQNAKLHEFIANCTGQNVETIQTCMDNISLKRMGRAEILIFKDELKKDLTLKMWQQIVAAKEEIYNVCMRENILKQSAYEIEQTTNFYVKRAKKKREATKALEVEKKLQNIKIKEDLEKIKREKFAFEGSGTSLHEKLFKEKQLKKNMQHESLCKKTVRDVIDLAIKTSEYKREFGKEMPSSVKLEYKKSFIAGLPILGKYESVHPRKKSEEVFEEIDFTPGELQKHLNLSQKELARYSSYTGEWSVDDVSEDLEEWHSVEKALNILSNIVHKLMQFKFPSDTVEFSPPNMPKTLVSACLVGLKFDHESEKQDFLRSLQQYLKTHNIRIIEIKHAIDYCMEVYNKEIDPGEYACEIPIEPSETDSSRLKRKDAKEGKKGGKKNANAIETQKALGMVHKQIQTPRVFPEDVIDLSDAGTLGETVHQILESHQQITDTLLIDIIVEYLISLKDIKGWLLVDFPTNSYQASLFEMKISGIEIPNVNLLTRYYKSILDMDAEKPPVYESPLLPNPKTDDFRDWGTNLTAFIHVQAMKSNQAIKKKTLELYSDVGKSEEEKDMVAFYLEQGCYYAFTYSRWDARSIKQLAKIVIGDYSLPLQDSFALVGEASQYDSLKGPKDPQRNSLDSKEEDLSIKQSKSSKPSKGSKQVPVSKKQLDKRESISPSASKTEEIKPTKQVEKFDKQTQFPSGLIVPASNTEIVTEEIAPQPGELNWNYIDLPVNMKIGLDLSNLWQTTENNYLSDLEELFIQKSITVYNIIPYLKYIKGKLESFIARPLLLYEHMENFREIFNTIAEDLRQDKEMKRDLHTQIEQMKEKLYEVCDENMMKSEDKRIEVIKENWILVHVNELTNFIIQGFQIEIDRFSNTLMLLVDYYKEIITSSDTMELGFKQIVLAKSTSEDYKNLQIDKYMIDVNEDMNLEMLEQHLKYFFDTSISYTDSQKEQSLKIYENLASYSKPVKVTREEINDKIRKRVLNIEISKHEASEVVRNKMGDIMNEWIVALMGEYCRCHLRLKMWYKNGIKMLHLALFSTHEVLKEVYYSIQNLYNQRLENIDDICGLFHRAVFKEEPLTEEFYFDGESFVVPECIKESEDLSRTIPKDSNNQFTVEQLDKLTDIFWSLSPSGLLPKIAFMYVIEDLIDVLNNDTKQSPLLPQVWSKLTHHDVESLCEVLYKDNEYVNWKDFILWNLNCFPTEEELLQALFDFSQFDPCKTENIKDCDYEKVRIWIDKYADNGSFMRKMLFKMYRVKPKTLNFTALLLDMCKDVKSRVGFAKAIELCIGRAVCHNVVKGEEYVDRSIKNRILKEEMKREELLQLETLTEQVRECIESAIDKIVHECDSVLITEITESNEKLLNEDIHSKSFERKYDETSNPSKVVLNYLNTSYEEEAGESLEDEEDSDYAETYGSSSVASVNVNIEEPLPLNRTVEEMAHFLSLRVVLNVVTLTIPWHCRVENITDLSYKEEFELFYKNCRREDFNDRVFSHEFLNHPTFDNLIRRTTKFSAVCMEKLVDNLVNK